MSSISWGPEMHCLQVTESPVDRSQNRQKGHSWETFGRGWACAVGRTGLTVTLGVRSPLYLGPFPPVPVTSVCVHPVLPALLGLCHLPCRYSAEAFYLCAHSLPSVPCS